MAEAPLTRAHVLNVVLTYAAVASLWILLSDKAVEWLFSTPAQFALLAGKIRRVREAVAE